MFAFTVYHLCDFSYRNVWMPVSVFLLLIPFSPLFWRNHPFGIQCSQLCLPLLLKVGHRHTSLQFPLYLRADCHHVSATDCSLPRGSNACEQLHIVLTRTLCLFHVRQNACHFPRLPVFIHKLVGTGLTCLFPLACAFVSHLQESVASFLLVAPGALLSFRSLNMFCFAVGLKCQN